MPSLKHSPRFFNVGYLQFDVQMGDIAANLTQVKRGLARLAPQSPAIIVLPELWATGFAYRRLPQLASRTPDILLSLQRLAAQYEILLAGSLPERNTTNSYLYNTLYITGPSGFIGSCRKQHLFSPMQEDKYLYPGNNPQPIDTPLGRLAGLVCYDLRFPELARSHAASGAAMLLISAQWPSVRKEHWRILVQARAIENQLFVVAGNRCGADRLGDGTTYAGHSMIVGPDGDIIHEAGENEEQQTASIDITLLDAVRGRFNTVAPSPYMFPDHDKIVD